uniref:Golgin subfamily A conserved domain-containing protein n=1 Tax=Timema bartmani TaxID=61472 RepID=A0A7R9F242_9NEOP|nr:unnamed protein product [Timema bartmani]
MLHQERIQALSKQNTELRTLLAQSDSRDANTQDGSTPTTDRKDDMLATLSASVRQLELERDQLLEQLKGLQVTEGDVTASPEESAPLSSNEDEKKLTAMEQLEERFTRTMKEVAELSDEKQRLEHLVLQLQGETETIGEYIALYQTQRIVLRQRARDKDEQLARLAQDREDLRSKLANLNNLVHRLVGGQEGTRVGDADTVQSQASQALFEYQQTPDSALRDPLVQSLSHVNVKSGTVSDKTIISGLSQLDVLLLLERDVSDIELEDDSDEEAEMNVDLYQSTSSTTADINEENELDLDDVPLALRLETAAIFDNDSQAIPAQRRHILRRRAKDLELLVYVIQPHMFSEGLWYSGCGDSTGCPDASMYLEN